MNKHLIALTSALGIALAVPAIAQDQRQPMPRGQEQGQGMQQNEAMKGRRAVIGEVVDTREINLKGVATKHRLVKIKNEKGNTIVINVGDATRTPATRFKKGSMIVAVGKEARINGRPVLYARYVGDLREAGSMGKVAQR